MALRSSADDYLKNLNLKEEDLHIRQTGEGSVFSQLKVLCIEDKMLYECISKAKQFVLNNPYTTKTTFLSFGIWKKILVILKNYLINQIVNDIKVNGGGFGIEIDSTTDIAGKHQVSVVVKYVKEEKNSSGEKCFVVNERTVALKPIKNCTSANIYNFLQCNLQNIGLDISNMTGINHVYNTLLEFIFIFHIHLDFLAYFFHHR